LQGFFQNEVLKYLQAKPFLVGESFQALKTAGLLWSHTSQNFQTKELSWLMPLVQDAL